MIFENLNKYEQISNVWVNIKYLKNRFYYYLYLLLLN